jgi:hypothetical protein
MTSTINNNVRMPRKMLATEIDRLDALLDGLAENLNEAVAMAVKDTVAQAVREAVAVAVKEVLSNADLLRSALGQHTAPTPQAQPATATTQRRSIGEVIKSGWSWVCKKGIQATTPVKKKLGQGLTWCLEKLRQGCAALRQAPRRLAACCVEMMAMLGAASLTLWRLRRSCSIALGVGLLAGVIGYVAGPILSSVLCGLGGMALSLSSMVLLPLWRLLRWNVSDVGD